MSFDATPGSKCPVCLDRSENVTYLDHCCHKFCFCCGQEWSKKKSECPLCKQLFHPASSDNCVLVGYVKPLAERTPELVELSSDSKESVGEKSKDVKNVQPIQFHSFSDTDVSGYASPFSVRSGDGSTNYKTSTSLSNKRKSKRCEKDSAREPATRSWLQNSPTKQDSDEDYGLSKRRKRDSSAQHSHSREHRGLKSKRKHRSMEKRKRKRDRSRHKRRKDKKKSRTRDKSLSRKSRTLSLSSERIESRGLSRSRSHGDYSKSRSKSKDSDYYLRNSYIRDGKYKQECTIYSQNSTRDRYESYRRRVQPRAQYSRQSPSPEYRVQSFPEWMNSLNPRGHQESRYCCYETHRSRSRSRSRSRTPLRGRERVQSEKPSGKRKYKTHHLESTYGGSEEASSAKDDLEKPLSEYRGSDKKSESFSDRQPEAESQHKKRRQVSRSPSVEIIYEGKATNMAGHHKKKRKTEREPHKSHIDPSPFSSSVVITINSDSDKDTEVQENTEYESSISWSPTIPENEREPGSPSSFLESQDSHYDSDEELESHYKDSVVTSTTGKTRGRSDNAVLAQPQGAANRHTHSSCAGGSTSATGNQPSSEEADSSSYLFDVEEPLLFRLTRQFLEEQQSRTTYDSEAS